MKSSIMNLFGGFSHFLGESKLLARLYTLLPTGFKTYNCFFTPTFSQTNVTKTVDIPALGRLCGSLREVYGLKMMPYFKENVEAGFNLYVLKTVASRFYIYDHLKFGQKIKIRVSVAQVDEASGNFSLRFSFVFRKKTLAMVEQEIFYVITSTEKALGKEVKRKVFQAIRCLDLGFKKPFDLISAMKFCSGLKTSSFDYSFPFRWDIRSCTEEGNTNHAAFLEYLMAGLEGFLVEQDSINQEKLLQGKIFPSNLEISYLKDFVFFQESEINFFKEGEGIYKFIFKSRGKEKSLAGGTLTIGALQ